MSATRPAADLSINPASGYWPPDTAIDNFAIPEGISSSASISGFEQQTFLGATIRTFGVQAGFGDTASTLSVDLINDEFNFSDKISFGDGDDAYHNGEYDQFAPPPVGSPVYFKYGKEKASVEEAYTNLYDQIYGDSNSFSSFYGDNVATDLEDVIDIATTGGKKSKGKFHFCFGGILQSYVENRGPGGDPVYSVQVVDPREILSNATLILNSYGGSAFNVANVFNLYGFLEFNPTENLKTELGDFFPNSGVLDKYIKPDGTYYYAGNPDPSGFDMYALHPELFKFNNFTSKAYSYPGLESPIPAVFPITGTGFSRRGPQGIPYYRVRQAINALFFINGQLPQEYLDAGFGTFINFRGFNYIVDFSGLPDNVPPLYYLDFDQINLLDFCLELCEVTSRELFISLLPVINHPACKRFYDWNILQMSKNDPTKLIAGIIRIDCIDKSIQPRYGAIKQYIDTLAAQGVHIENRDVGFELSNVSTDKFVAGAQEVDMYYFSNNNDRGHLQNRMSLTGENALPHTQDQWRLEEMLKQQILPYYGMLGQAVTIPKGFGSYQQIMLDASSLNAVGVSEYYVTTEMELRAASISYERWCEFLVQYNDVYMESTEENDAVDGFAVENTPVHPDMANNVIEISANYGVTVPRSVWPSTTEEYVTEGKLRLPKNVCNPPYGYPLYFKRAERIGVQSLGLVKIAGKLTQIVTDLASLGDPNNPDFINYLDSTLKDLENAQKLSCFNLSEEDQYKKDLFEAVRNGTVPIGVVFDAQNAAAGIQRTISRLQKRTKQNSMRIYNWLKKIADECLGKKFLVKIPREVNIFFNKQIISNKFNGYQQGPFGFRPRAINKVPGYEYTPEFNAKVLAEQSAYKHSNNKSQTMIEGFLTRLDPNPQILTGALQINFNPITEIYDTNYTIDKNGGYFDFDLANNYFNLDGNFVSLGMAQGLIPIDTKSVMNSNNRISAYVRFDHSENLSFDGFDPSEFTQQSIHNNFFIPDIAGNLENNDSQNFEFSFPSNPAQQGKAAQHDPPRKPAVAFIKCDVDENFYMAPKLKKDDSGKNIEDSVNVHATRVFDLGTFKTKPIIRRNPETCLCETFLRGYTKHLIPTDEVSKSVLIYDFDRDLTTKEYKTSIRDLDTDNVYALITLPNKVIPTVDKRFLDGPSSEVNGGILAHLLTMDVVKIPEFKEPALMNRPLTIDTSALSPAQRAAGLIAKKTALNGLQFGLPQQIQLTAPSPVYPDLVVLPFQSKERCYGPWISSYLNNNVYSNIGGRVDFVKDENLAPWNFNGYDLMNSAGILQAQFSNSMLLQLERGGLVVPAAPSGIYLGRYLNNFGPLLTNISIDISDNGIKTTYKFDLYTVSFGKLAKQKQDQIANISRERQKLRDERNALIRKGLGKNQSADSFIKAYSSLENSVDNLKPPIYYGSPPTTFVISADPQSEQIAPPTQQLFGNSSFQSYNTVSNQGSLCNTNDIGELASNLEPDQLLQKYSRSASANITDIFKPVDTSHGGNKYLHHMPRGIEDDSYYS